MGFLRHVHENTRNLSNIVNEVSMPEWFEQVTIGDLLDRQAQGCGEQEALAFAGQRWNVQQLQADSDRAARGLMQCGIQPGDRG